MVDLLKRFLFIYLFFKVWIFWSHWNPHLSGREKPYKWFLFKSINTSVFLFCIFISTLQLSNWVWMWVLEWWKLSSVKWEALKKIPPGLRMPKIGRNISLIRWNRNATVLLTERLLYITATIFEWCPTRGKNGI